VPAICISATVNIGPGTGHCRGHRTITVRIACTLRPAAMMLVVAAICGADDAMDHERAAVEIWIDVSGRGSI